MGLTGAPPRDRPPSAFTDSDLEAAPWRRSTLYQFKAAHCSIASFGSPYGFTATIPIMCHHCISNAAMRW
jgi:hypothetical protein